MKESPLAGGAGDIPNNFFSRFRVPLMPLLACSGPPNRCPSPLNSGLHIHYTVVGCLHPRTTAAPTFLEVCDRHILKQPQHLLYLKSAHFVYVCMNPISINNVILRSRNPGNLCQPWMTTILASKPPPQTRRRSLECGARGEQRMRWCRIG
jgi:hypothetical protein